MHISSPDELKIVKKQLRHALKIGLDMPPVVVLDRTYQVIDTSADNLRLVFDELLSH